MVRISTPNPRILQSSIAALALTVFTGASAFAAAPIAGNDTAEVADGASVLINVLGNDSDADEEDTLQIQSVTTPAVGSAVIEGGLIRYTAPLGASGPVTFSYTVTDGEETATADVTVEVTSVPLPTKQVNLFAKVTGGSPVPGAGVEESGIEEESAFTGFGIPSINEVGEVAVLARYKSPTTRTVTAIFAGAPLSLVAKKGDAAPGIDGAPQTGVAFSSFRDPLLSERGQVAFLAKLSGEVTAKNSTGLYTNAFGESLTQVIRTGDAAPGISGATIRKILSVALTSHFDSGTESTISTIFFTAALSIGSGTPAVTRADDQVLFCATAGGITPVLREGQPITLGSDTTVKSFRALVARTGAAGNGRSAVYLDNTGAPYATVLINTTDGRRAAGYVHIGGSIIDYVKGATGVGYGPEGLWYNFGNPTMNAKSALSFVGTAKSRTGTATSSNNVAIYTEDENDAFKLKQIVAKGDVVPGIPSATFSSFKDPVNATGKRVAFAGKVRGATADQDQGIWFRDGNGVLDIVAREGAQPPGVPAGAKFASFTAVGLSDGPFGAPLFLAKLVRPSGEQPNPAEIEASNSIGLWARDAYGRLHLVQRYGDEITVDGATTTVRSFVALKSVTGSPAQSRFFNNRGEIYYRANCKNGTQALVKFKLPILIP